MSKNPVRVLQILSSLQAAGIESFITNIHQHIDKDQIQFDFLVYRDNETDRFYEHKVIENGGEIYRAYGNSKIFFIKQIQRRIQAYKIMKSGHYDIVHIHASSGIQGVDAFLAHFSKIKNIFVHSHNIQFSPTNGHLYLKKIVDKLGKLIINRYGTVFLACSEDAGNWLFGTEKKVYVIKNGIDVYAYRYNPSIRNAYRKKMEIDNKFVIGHIGRFSIVKNHSFLLKVFSEVKKKRKDAVLLLVGDGELKEKILHQARSLDLTADDVKFLGVRHDVSALMQAMDIFVFPSLYEGLGIVLIEAQAAGLPCIVSDNVPKESKIISYFQYLSLSDDISKWVSAILSYDKGACREEKEIQVVQAGFDIASISNELSSLYFSVTKNDKTL